jgi:hypothetical protein
MAMKECPKCKLFHEELEANGLCYKCDYMRPFTLCPICETYYMTEEDTVCRHEEKGLDVLKKEQEENSKWAAEEWPLTAEDTNLTNCKAISHYYGFIAEQRYYKKETVQEASERLDKYVKENNLSKELVSEYIDMYHAMYGC